MTDIRLLYVTTESPEQAQSIARSLIERRLIACANILPAMQSIYRWEGEIQTANEAVLIFKTDFSLVEETTKAVLELHSYDTPCVLTLAVESGSDGYLRWLSGEVVKTKESQKPKP